jgi:hypothetical protein
LKILILEKIQMAEEALSNAGLYLDELNKIRLLDPESAQQTTELKDECKDFVESKIRNFLVYFSKSPGDEALETNFAAKFSYSHILLFLLITTPVGA